MPVDYQDTDGNRQHRSIYLVFLVVHPGREREVQDKLIYRVLVVDDPEAERVLHATYTQHSLLGKFYERKIQMKGI